MKQENKPTEVPSRDKQSGEAYELRKRLGAEPVVWSERMLAALKSGVKRGKWFSLKVNTSPRWDCSALSRPIGKRASLAKEQSSTGEPDAGDPHVRFGGRGGSIPFLPLYPGVYEAAVFVRITPIHPASFQDAIIFPPYLPGLETLASSPACFQHELEPWMPSKGK